MGPVGDSQGGGTQSTSDPSGLTGWNPVPGGGAGELFPRLRVQRGSAVVRHGAGQGLLEIALGQCDDVGRAAKAPRVQRLHDREAEAHRIRQRAVGDHRRRDHARDLLESLIVVIAWVSHARAAGSPGNTVATAIARSAGDRAAPKL